MIQEADSSDFWWEPSGKPPVTAGYLQETTGFGSRNTAPISGVRLCLVLSENGENWSPNMKVIFQSPFQEISRVFRPIGPYASTWLLVSFLDHLHSSQHKPIQVSNYFMKLRIIDEYIHARTEMRE
jgi:hypothetical protein